MARTSPNIEVTIIKSNLQHNTRVALRTPSVKFAADMAELIKRMISDGSLEVKNGQITPKGK